MSGEVVLAARVYRDLLKAVVKHVGKEDHKAHFTEFVKQEFRNKANSEKIDLARNYTYLLNSIHSHKDLLFSYNIAVDRTEEMKRVLGKSAASVGLRLPEVYQP
uniref:Complex 1 LYR protein n=1 Tax=Noccaea caerulescens TaxID=107243 RepID=A0A1J3EFD6_NOCCA